MGPGDITLFDMARKKMRYLTQRQDVLAQNVANADTPDYQARDLVPLDFDQTLAQQFVRLQMRPAAMGESLPGTLPTDPRFRDPESRMIYEQSLDGNNVVLEEQLLKVQETQMEYQASVRLIRKYHAMMKTALGRNGV
ncbi:MAG: flagellar basal body rod protein FlgB [Pseudomonadota bacterium]